MLIALVAEYDLQINQIYVKTTSLNGELEKQIYMEQPAGFVVPIKEKKVWKLVKSLYRLNKHPDNDVSNFTKNMVWNGLKMMKVINVLKLKS